MSFKAAYRSVCIVFLAASECVMAARWVGPDAADAESYGVYFFRNEFDVAADQESLKIEISADNRYRFYLNGEQLACGPARGDLAHWRYETLELSRRVKTGKNVLSAIVWNAAEHKPVAQVTDRTGFWVKATRADLETGAGNWRMKRTEAYEPEVQKWWEWARGWYAVGAGQRLDGRKLEKDWMRSGFSDDEWSVPQTVKQPKWNLEPRPFPLFPEKRFDFQEVGASDHRMPLEKGKLFASNGQATLLLDLGRLAIGDAEFVFRGGKDAEIQMIYAEAPFKNDGLKHNRNVTEGAQIEGLRDVYVADGSERQVVRPLQWRCARYVELRVNTQSEPLILEDAAFYCFPAFHSVLLSHYSQKKKEHRKCNFQLTR